MHGNIRKGPEDWAVSSALSAGPNLAQGHNLLKNMAERVGFEPTVPEGTTVFETARFNHSRTSPWLGGRIV